MDPHYDGVIYKTHPAELYRRIQFAHPPFLVIDVRSAAERSKSRIEGSIALGASDLAEALPEGSTPGTEFVVVGVDQYDEEIRRAVQSLRALGALRVVELAGGMFEWQAERMPLEASADS